MRTRDLCKKYFEKGVLYNMISIFNIDNARKRTIFIFFCVAR